MPVTEAPPAIVQPVSQSQEQNQEQQQYNAPVINSSNANNAGANSATESNAALNQEGSLNNIQVNNDSSNSVYRFGNGLDRPTTSLGVTAYSHSGSSGIAATLFIPLGGNTSKQHESLVNSRIKRIDLDNQAIAIQSELELATACAKIAAANVVIDLSQFPMLARCKYITVRPTPTPILSPPPPPPVQKLIPPVKVIEPPTDKPLTPRKGIPALW